MGRNCEKEAKWAKEKYRRIFAYVDKEKADKFREKLEKEGKIMSEFIKGKIDEYLKK